MKRKRPIVPLILIGFSVLFFLSALFHTRLNPLTEELAAAKISDVASNIINEAVNDQIVNGEIQYGDLVTLCTDQNGNITALTTNMKAMNRLKSQLLMTLDDDIYDISVDRISIPLGNLTGVQLFSGLGPKIPVKIVAVSSSDAEFTGEFVDAGINQTIHRIVLEISLDLVILLPSGTITERVTTDVCVAETVLLGAVPEHYTYFNGMNEDYVKIFTME